MAKTIEELEAESNSIGKKFEEDFENTARTFFKSVSEFGDRMDESTASDVVKNAILTGMIKSLASVEAIIERVAKEEGIS